MMNMKISRLALTIILLLNIILFLVMLHYQLKLIDVYESDDESEVPAQTRSVIIDNSKTTRPRVVKQPQANLDQEAYYLNLVQELRHLPMVIVGGHFRSGTTLMRAILDVHPNLNCGPETNILPNFLMFLTDFQNKPNKLRFMSEGGISKDLVDQASMLFMYHLLKYRSFINPAESNVTKQFTAQSRICTKDPEILRHIKYLHRVFPKAKFIHMYRDGRAVAYSYMNHRRLKEPSWETFLHYLERWDNYTEFIDYECEENLGSDFCIQIKYEDLVMEPRRELEKVMKFLNESWTDELLRHEQHIGGEVAVSKIEWSTNQIKKEINNASLSYHVWLDQMPYYNPDQIKRNMLVKYGYDLRIGYNKSQSTLPPNV